MGNSSTNVVEKFTIVLCVKNEEARLENFLLNIQSMNFISSLIVVDGGSNDRTLEILRNYSGFRVIQAGLVGLLAQRLIGVRNSKTDFVLLVNVDDQFTKQGLEGVIGELVINPQIDGLQFSLKSQASSFWGRAWDSYFKLVNPPGGSILLLGRPCVARREVFIFDPPEESIFNEDTWIHLQEKGLDRKYRVSHNACIRSCPETLSKNLIQFWKYGRSDFLTATSHSEHLKLLFHSAIRITFFRGFRLLLGRQIEGVIFVLLMGFFRSSGHIFSMFSALKSR